MYSINSKVSARISKDPNIRSEVSIYTKEPEVAWYRYKIVF